MMPRKRNAETPTCKNCDHAAAPKKRGLCNRCGDNPEIREQYPTRPRIGTPRDVEAAIRAGVAARRARNSHKPRCLHCKINARQSHRRGLCNRCYLSPKIRAKYPAYKRSYIEEGTGKGSRPTFAWSDDPSLYPCARCTVGASDRKGTILCLDCQARYPDWEPAEKEQPPLRMCLQVCEVGR